MLVYIAALIALVAAGVLYWVTGLLWVLFAGFFGVFAVTGGLMFFVIWLSCRLVDLEKPTVDSKYFRAMLTAIAKTIPVILMMRLKVTGLEKLPKNRKVMLVCNHLANLDPVSIQATFPGLHLAYISKQENTDMFLVGKIMHKTLCQLINRENDREALKTILNCISILKEDKASIAVFPEGYINGDGLLHPFRYGVFKIAQRAQVPIVVCTIRNTDHVFENFWKLRPSTVNLDLLDVLYPEDYAGKTTVDIGTQVHKIMADNLGPELVWQGNV